jgi:hypothetical protein
MKTMRYGIVSNFLLALGAAIVTLFVECGTMDGTGSSTQTGITGKIYNDDGTPAKNATVSIIASGYIPSISGIGKSAPVDSIITDENGTYVIRWLAPGTYNVFGKKADRFCYQDSVLIDSTTSTIENDTLREAGSLSGIVRLQPNDDSRTVLILIYGCNTFTYPEDFTGNFSITNLAQGSYRIKVLTTIQGYAPKDTVITIVSGRNDTLSDTMRLDYLGIPTVAGLAAAWDSLLLKAHISWDRQDTSIIAGYNIYRGVADSTFNDQPINAVMIVTYTFVDTFDCASARTWQGKRYVYRVKPINKNGDVGAVYSNADTIAAESAYKQIKTITRNVFDSTEAFIYRDRIYLINTIDSSIEVFDTAGTRLKSFGSSGSSPLVRPRSVSVANGFIFVADQEQAWASNSDSSSIKKYDTAGNFLSRMPISGLLAGIAAMDAGALYTMTVTYNSSGWKMDRVTLHHRDGTGAVIDSLSLRDPASTVSSFWILPKLLINGVQLTVMGALSSDTVEMLSLYPDLSVNKRVPLPGRAPLSFGIDSLGMTYCLTNDAVYIYDVNQSLFAQFPNFYSVSLAVDQKGKIVLKDNNGNVTVYERKHS